MVFSHSTSEHPSCCHAPRRQGIQRLAKTGSPAYAGDDIELVAATHELHSEISRSDFVARQRRRLAFERDAALLQAIDVPGRLQRLYDVLLDDDERQTLGDDRRNSRIDIADH